MHDTLKLKKLRIFDLHEKSLRDLLFFYVMGVALR
jgi:hypothetical protein